MGETVEFVVTPFPGWTSITIWPIVIAYGDTNREACRTRIDLLWCKTRKERHGHVIRERLLTMNGMTTDMKQQCIGGGGG